MPIPQANHCQAMSSFLYNVIMPMVRSNLDLTPDNIIEQISNNFFITIPYSKAYNARTKTLIKIFGD